jgi:hypothetical protein
MDGSSSSHSPNLQNATLCRHDNQNVSLSKALSSLSVVVVDESSSLSSSVVAVAVAVVLSSLLLALLHWQMM